MTFYPSADSVAQYLDPGERLLWSGQPRGGICLCAQDIFLVPFSLLWGRFAIFWEASVVSKGAPLFFMFWGIPFVCAGLFFIFGRFFFDAYNRKRTFYGVANERILIVNGVLARQAKSLPLRTLAEVTLTQRGDGSDTITFDSAPLMHGFFPSGGWPGAGRYVPPSFDLVERAREVYEIIRRAQREPAANA